MAEHICSILLKRDNYNIDLIGLESNNESDHLVCYVDTERNLAEQYCYSLQQIQLNSGHKITDDIVNFDPISLIDIDRKERFESLCQYLEEIRRDYKGHIIVILDVLTDLVENFNDPKQSLKLIDLLNTTINTHDTTFICLIHENPGDNFKARGHLGTELLNKSSTALSINFEKNNMGNDLDIIKIRFLKCRSSKKPEPLFLKFAENGFKLVFAEDSEVEKAIQSRAKKANIFDVAEFLVKNLKGRISKSNLFEMLTEEFACDVRTIEPRIKDMIKGTGLSDLGYSLKKVKIGREIYFELKKIIPENTQEEIF